MSPRSMVSLTRIAPAFLGTLLLLTVIMSIAPASGQLRAHQEAPAVVGSHSLSVMSSPPIPTDRHAASSAASEPRPSATTDPISVEGVDSTAVALSWQQSGDFCFTSYEIQEATYSSGGPWTTIGTYTSSGTTGLIIGGFSPGYQVWFQDIDNSGCGGGSATSNQVQPHFPSYATVSYSDSGSGSVELTWTNTASYGGLIAFGSYEVMEQVNGGGFQQKATVSSASDTSATLTGITGLNTGTQYQFFVVTTDDCAGCTGSWSTVQDTNTVTHLYLDQPTASSSPVDVGQHLTLSVTAHGGSGSYSYAWSGAPAGCPASGNPDTCSPSAAGASEVSVTVTDSAGVTVTSVQLSVTVDPLPSITDS